MNVMFATSFVFSMGYVLIILEHVFPKINKSAVALCSSFAVWAILIYNSNNLLGQLDAIILESFQVLFFLIGALTIVEYIDYRNGFEPLSRMLGKLQGHAFIIVSSILSFCISAMLDNMTTCIVMCLMTKSLVSDRKQRWYAMSSILLASNTGGAFTPIGDITTTMLWLKGLVTTFVIMKTLFIPCLISLMSAMILICYVGAAKEIEVKEVRKSKKHVTNLPLILGICSLIAAPVFKLLFGFPPFLTVIGAVGFMWLIDEILIDYSFVSNNLESKGMLSKVVSTDLSPVLFFYGILLGVGGLNVAGVLPALSRWIMDNSSNYIHITSIIGIASSFLDNVPIVASAIHMFDVEMYPVNSPMWCLLAYTAGVGGNILILGSAAGIALLSIEKIDISWYIKNISWIAFLAYVLGILIFIIQQKLFF